MPEALFDFTDDQPENRTRQEVAGEDKCRLAKVISLGAAATEIQPHLFEVVNPSQKERLDQLRQSAAYCRRVELIKTSFDFGRLESGMGLCDRDIPAPDLKRFDQWLKSYGGYLDQLADSDKDLHEVDQAILRVELRRLVTQLNRDFSDFMGELFPDSRDFQIDRLNHRQKQFYSDNDNYQPLKRRRMVYEGQQSIVILNSIGCNALFGASSYDVRRELLQKNINEDEAPSRRSLNLGRANRTSLYDLLPGQFLLARTWAVQSLRDFIDLRQASDSPRPFGFLGVADCFQSLNLEACALLNHPDRPADAAFWQKDLPGSTRPIRESERLLLEANWSDLAFKVIAGFDSRS